MSSARTKRRNSLWRDARELTRGDDDRFIDIGIALRLVRQDVQRGVEAIPSAPPLVAVRGESTRLGARYDTSTGAFIGPAESHLVWYIGERQSEILLRRDPSKSRTLLYSAEGGGKTVLMAQWLVVQVLILAQAGEPGFVGATAPTQKRLKSLRDAVMDIIPCDYAKERREGAWATWYQDDQELRFVTGHIIQFRATKKQSGATGSPIQGYTWKASGDDELQDTVENGADPDIEARLRGAQTSYRMCTATAKDSPNWRTFRDSKLSTPDWVIERIAAPETPFIWPAHWERMRRNMSPREAARRIDALDVGPERATYPTWNREKNLIPVPRIGAKDVTQQVIGASALIGHDPGKLCDVSLLLRCYEVHGKRLWWVEDEYTSYGTTSDQHIVGFRDYLQQTWQLQYPQPDEPKVLVRADPYSDSSEDHPDRGVYYAWKLHGFKALSAAYNAKGEGKGRVPKEARIEMVCRLLENAAGERRLFVACDEHRKPAAPELVKALEMSERDEGGKAEAQKKNKYDLSHWVAALGYALWPYERLRDVHGVRSVEGLG